MNLKRIYATSDRLMVTIGLVMINEQKYIYYVSWAAILDIPVPQVKWDHLSNTYTIRIKNEIAFGT